VLVRKNSCKEKRNGFLFEPCPGRKLKKENGTKGTVPRAPRKGMTHKRVETPPGKVRAIPPATNPVRQTVTNAVKRGK
jgi:hypothetical protein